MAGGVRSASPPVIGGEWHLRLQACDLVKLVFVLEVACYYITFTVEPNLALCYNDTRSLASLVWQAL